MCFKDDQRVFQGSFEVPSRELNGISKELKWCPMEVKKVFLRKFLGVFLEFKRVFQVYFVVV